MTTERDAYFSILRWRTDATRDEERNVAVILVDAEGRLGGMRAAPISSISPVLHEQGLLDSVIVALERRFATTARPRLADLEAMQSGLQHSLYLTSPRRVSAGVSGLTL